MLAVSDYTCRLKGGIRIARLMRFDPNPNALLIPCRLQCPGPRGFRRELLPGPALTGHPTPHLFSSLHLIASSLLVLHSLSAPPGHSSCRNSDPRAPRVLPSSRFFSTPSPSFAMSKFSITPQLWQRINHYASFVSVVGSG